MPEGLFTNYLFTFLKDLKRHNDRAWFAENKQRYVEVVQEPALEFVRAFDPFLAKISPQFVADGRSVGSSLSRIYRDVRFTKDKSPYKTHVVVSSATGSGRTSRRPATTFIWGRARSSPRRGSGGPRDLASDPNGHRPRAGGLEEGNKGEGVHRQVPTVRRQAEAGPRRIRPRPPAD